MKKRFEVFLAVILLCGARFIAASQEIKQPVEHLFFHVTLGPQFQQPVFGPAAAFSSAQVMATIMSMMDMMSPAATYIAAKRCHFLLPGRQSISMRTTSYFPILCPAHPLETTRPRWFSMWITPTTIPVARLVTWRVK